MAADAPDTAGGNSAVLRPYDPNAIDRLRGKYARRGPTVDESRQAGRADPERPG